MPETKGSERIMPITAGDWKEYRGGVYRCPVHLYLESDGRYSVVAADLPGVTTYADTEPEALEHVKEAIAAAMTAYRETGLAIP